MLLNEPIILRRQTVLSGKTVPLESTPAKLSCRRNALSIYAMAWSCDILNYCPIQSIGLSL